MRAFACGIAAVALFAASGGPTRAADGLDLATLRARMSAAVGPTPAAYAERWVVGYANDTATERIARRGEDFARIVERGPLEERAGSLHGTRWSRNENGIVNVAGPPSPAMLADDVVVAENLRRVTTPVDAWEIVVRHADGETLVTDVDPATYRIARIEHRRPGGATETETYSDYRTVAGFTRAYREHDADGARENDADRVLVGDATDVPLGDDAFAIPPDRVRPFLLPDGMREARLPTTFVDGVAYVRIDVAGRGYDFELDSGANGLFVTEGTAHALGLPVAHEAAMDVDARFATNVVTLPAARIGAVVVRDAVMRTIPEMTPVPGVQPCGLIGFDLLASLDLRIDYAARTIDAIAPGAFHLPSGPHRVLVSDFRYGVPLVAAAVDERPGTDFIFDTGATGTGILFERFAAKHGTALHRDFSIAPRLVQGVAGRPIATERTNVDFFTLAGVRFAPIAFDRVRTPGAFNMADIDGLIGRDVITRFTVTTDYANGQIVLEPRG